MGKRTVFESVYVDLIANLNFISFWKVKKYMFHYKYGALLNRLYKYYNRTIIESHIRPYYADAPSLCKCIFRYNYRYNNLRTHHYNHQHNKRLKSLEKSTGIIILDFLTVFVFGTETSSLIGTLSS